MEERIVRYGELVPCRTAFIDAHTPGSDQKENFTIIGGGVSESPDQHVHIKETPGFKYRRRRAAAEMSQLAPQPPHRRGVLRAPRTLAVLLGPLGHGRASSCAEEGDIFNIPTGIFRGFENVGTDYGMIMAILGGDDAGGGVIWAPQVIEDAKDHGLVLAKTVSSTTQGGATTCRTGSTHAAPDQRGVGRLIRRFRWAMSCRTTSPATGT